MAKKKPIKKIFENMPVESTETDIAKAQPVQPDQQDETNASDPRAQKETAETSPGEEQSSGGPATAADETASSAEDLLEDVRQSLIEEEADKTQKESKWWRRIGKKAKKVEPEEPPLNAETDLSATPAVVSSVDFQEQKQEPEEEIDQIEDLIEMLKAESEAATVESTSTPEVQAPSEPEPQAEFEKLKEQAFRPRTPEDEPESDVRSVALEDGEEVFVEVQSQVPNPMEERLSAVENVFRPYRRYIYTAVALLGVGVVVVASLIIFRVVQQSRPQPTAQVSNLPYPTLVSLPGGWSFQLGRGSVQNGTWDPQGAEWLEGTEVCRWVALPWSRQLEAVIRTLNPNDPIELVMSNNDKLIYGVYSVRQLSPEEMQELDSNSPCLLLILTQSDSDERWVLTALP
jgi:hypothetical protein